MPKTPTELSPTDTPTEAPVEILGLQQWCEIKSHTLGKSVEMLSGFFHRCRKNGIDNLPKAEFEKLYQSFITAPAGRG